MLWEPQGAAELEPGSGMAHVVDREGFVDAVGARLESWQGAGSWVGAGLQAEAGAGARAG